jgi:hypothetical protein
MSTTQNKENLEVIIKTPKTPAYTLKAIKKYEAKNQEKLKQYRKDYYQAKKDQLKEHRISIKKQTDTLKQQLLELSSKIALIEKNLKV